MPAQSPPAPSEDLLFSSSATPPPGSHASSSGSGMSDERNADSVLFKLDTLTQLTTPGELHEQAPPRQPSPLVRLAAHAPASKGESGLIDIRALATAEASASLGSSPSGSSPSGSSPSISSSSISSSSISSSTLLSSGSVLGVVPSPEAHATVVPGEAPSRAPGIILIILSVLAVLALAAAVTAIVLRGL